MLQQPILALKDASQDEEAVTADHLDTGPHRVQDKVYSRHLRLWTVGQNGIKTCTDSPGI
ncbi:hypothetical protein EYF80_034827 [Liparis tanakae]|uniref:Uncharacterized protein n=1 Tax=Liparis tanakae TaxID=230148 RepID=A0A4Z2GNN3_9TELE|nr:hypothetical protein EYF80_034827 [Liparis tanakae]